MGKLHQIVAVESSEKTRLEKARSAIYQTLQKPALFAGMVRTYQPSDENGEQLPDERQEVQMTVREAVTSFQTATSRLIDLTATKDYGNALATSDISVGGTVIVKDAPVPFILFLEKQLENLDTFIRHMPTLDRAKRWKYGENTGLYESDPETRRSTRKEQEPVVLFPATVEHPAQTQMITKDVLQGIWTAVNYSGGITETQRDEWLERVTQLRVAVKEARCNANDTEAQMKSVGKDIFNFVFEA